MVHCERASSVTPPPGSSVHRQRPDATPSHRRDLGVHMITKTLNQPWIEDLRPMGAVSADGRSGVGAGAARLLDQGCPVWKGSHTPIHTGWPPLRQRWWTVLP